MTHRTEAITAAIATTEPETEGVWRTVDGLDGWSICVDEDRITISVPVEYVDAECPEKGYSDDYNDIDEVLGAPYDSGMEDDGSGEYWMYQRRA